MGQNPSGRSAAITRPGEGVKRDKFTVLERLAHIHGIESSYVDATGQTRIVSPETLIALLRALGINASDDHEIKAAFAHAEEARNRTVVEPVCVVWGQRPARVTFNCSAAGSASRIKCVLHLEDGTNRALRIATSSQHHDVFIPNLPYGYHRLEVHLGNSIVRSLLISASQHAYNDNSNQRRWGLFAPVYALHSEKSWGAGDFCDVAELAEWIGSLGGTLMGTLPITVEFLENPFDPSPYSPASRLFWNEFYLHIPGIPEFRLCKSAQRLVQSTAFEKQLRKFGRSRWVNYRAEMAAKRSVLELLSEFFFAHNSQRRRPFETLLRSRPELVEYARFCAVTEQQKTGWTNWPQRLQLGKFTTGDYSVQAERYYLYAQFCAQEQIDQLASCFRQHKSLFYLDLSLGVNAESFDAWRERALFVSGANGGAPPDPYFTKGQDWGFSPLHPQKIREDGYRYYLNFLRFQMRHTGLLRLDHIMGLYRLYWIPKGFPASAGAYVRYPAEELFAILCLESQRHKTALIGENLGTVPPEVNAAMDKHKISRMFVVQYEQRPDRRKALRPPPCECIASMNTHDMPTFNSYWKGLDIPDRAELGLLPRERIGAAKKLRRKSNAALVQFLQHKRLLARKGAVTEKQVLCACLKFLAASKTQFLLINLEDLWSEAVPQNTPGTTSERRNWRHKTRLTLDEIKASPNLRAILAEIDRLRRRAQRTGG